MKLTDDDSPLDTMLAELVEEILGHMHAGRPVDIDSYRLEYPQLASRIGELIPTLHFLGEAKKCEFPQAASLDTQRSQDAVSLSDHPTPHLDDFRIETEIGRGGMGVVYLAHQISLDRPVALKVLPFAAITNDRRLKRFEIEAQAAASLSHRSIVPIYSVGCDGGVHYYAMQYIRGPSLASILNDLREQSGLSASTLTLVDTTEHSLATNHETSRVTLTCDVWQFEWSTGSSEYYRALAKLAIQAAEALEHAHEHGVIHRDIKPGNLLISAEGRLWVTDFGLAQIEHSPDLTMEGELVGTIRYMSPEQVAGHRTAIDHRCDIYSLGATLYELLTLRPPFAANDRQTLLADIIAKEPIKPRRLNAAIPDDLETIVLKAMEKAPASRYDTAQAMADDLNRFLAELPIAARRPTVYVRARKWMKRHPAVLRSALAIAAVISVTWVIGSILLYRQQLRTTAALVQSNKYFERSEQNRVLAEEASSQFEQLLYVRALGLAARAWREGDGAGAVALMRSNPAFASNRKLRGFEWNVLENSLSSRQTVIAESSTAEFTAARISPIDDTIAIACSDGMVILDRSNGDRQLLEGHRSQVHALDFSPNGRQLISGSADGDIRIWDVANGNSIGVIEKAHQGADVFACRYFHDGRSFVSGGGDHFATIWDAESLQRRRSCKGHSREVRSVDVSADDRLIATASNDREARVWNVSTGHCNQTLRNHTGMILAIAFTVDDRYVITGSNDHTIRLWDHRSGQEVAVLKGHQDAVQSIAVTSDGERFIAGDRGGNLKLWQIEGRRAVDQFRERSLNDCLSVRFAPDGRSWAALTADGRLVLRDLASKRTETLLAALPNHYPHQQTEKLVFAPHGDRLFCTDRIISPQHGTDSPPTVKLDVLAGAAGQFSPDGKTLAAVWNQEIRLFDSQTGTAVDQIESPVDPLLGARFSTDGSELLVWSLYGEIARCDLRDKTFTQGYAHPRERIVDLEWDQPGGRIVACSESGVVRQWQESTRMWTPLELGERKPSSICWGPDRQSVVMTSPGLESVLYRFDEPSSPERLAVNRDSNINDYASQTSLLLTAGTTSGIEVRDMTQLEIRSSRDDSFQGHSDRVWAVDVSADDRRFLSVSRDRTARMWRPSEDRYSWLSRSRHPVDQVDDLQWSIDGNVLALAQFNRVTLHDWKTGEQTFKSDQITPPADVPLGYIVESVGIDTDGKFVAAGYRDGLVRVWERSTEQPTRQLNAKFESHWISALTFSSNRKWLAGCNRQENVIVIWETENWSLVHRLDAADCDDIHFSPVDGNQLLFCDGLDAVIFDVATGNELQRFGRHSITVHGVAFSNDGRLAATACEDRKLRVWDVKNGSVLSTLGGHSAPILQVAFSSDDKTIATGDESGSIRLWHLPTGHELYELANLGVQVRRLRFVPGRNVLVAVGEDGRANVFDGEPLESK